MRKEVKGQRKVSVNVDTLWKALSKDMVFIVPKIVPSLVKSIHLVEGDGGLNSILLFNFGSDVPLSYQKEKIVELDDSQHRIGIQVIEGGHLNLGFSFYKTTFQLTRIREKETLVDVVAESESESTMEENMLPPKTAEFALSYIKSLETYLLSIDS